MTMSVVNCQLNRSPISDSTLLFLLLLSFLYFNCACLAYKTTSGKFLWWLFIIIKNITRAQKRVNKSTLRSSLDTPQLQTLRKQSAQVQSVHTNSKQAPHFPLKFFIKFIHLAKLVFPFFKNFGLVPLIPYFFSDSPLSFYCLHLQVNIY